MIQPHPPFHAARPIGLIGVKVVSRVPMSEPNPAPFSMHLAAAQRYTTPRLSITPASTDSLAPVQFRTGARVEAWCILIRAEASLSLLFNSV